MIKTFTPNDILRYLYKETNTIEIKHFEQAMLVHTDILDQYVQLTDVKEQLDQIYEAPSDATIQAILDYSSSDYPILS
ncbi:MAG: hypothetical protein DHS20C17_19520 [Cyclobacteriaceae bacterium]|nr:MAG: hypothetical protein DHS20C17_19520 [Cyclobacteriaceae bacterium]